MSFSKEKLLKELKGILPATVSPNHLDGSFDPVAMRKIVRHQLDAGSDGVYVCGGTGEGLLMSHEDREQALRVYKGSLAVLKIEKGV